METCLRSLHGHIRHFSRTCPPPQHSQPLQWGETQRGGSTDGAARLPSCRSHRPAGCAAWLCLPPRSALCAASRLPPLRQMRPTSPPPRLAAPQNWSGSRALKYQQGTGTLVSLISAAGLTGKQNGGVWWERESRERCRRRANVEREGMEKNQAAEEREGAARDGERA